MLLTKELGCFYYKLATNIIDTKKEKKGGGGKESGIGTFKSSITRALGFLRISQTLWAQVQQQEVVLHSQTEKDYNFANRYVGGGGVQLGTAAAFLL